MTCGGVSAARASRYEPGLHQAHLLATEVCSCPVRVPRPHPAATGWFADSHFGRGVRSVSCIPACRKEPRLVCVSLSCFWWILRGPSLPLPPSGRESPTFPTLWDPFVGRLCRPASRVLRKTAQAWGRTRASARVLALDTDPLGVLPQSGADGQRSECPEGQCWGQGGLLEDARPEVRREEELEEEPGGPDGRRVGQHQVPSLREGFAARR